MLIVPCWGQQTSPNKPSLKSQLARLRSDDGGDRDAAFYQLRSDPAAMRNPQVQSALLDLLDRENQESTAGKHAGEGEGYGEYYSDLLGSVESFANWGDPRPVCILVRAGATPDGPTAAETAARMKIAIPCLLKMSKGVDRVTAVPILVKALAKTKDNLDSGNIQTVEEVISLALHDSDEGVRLFTVDALGSFGEPDMIPALKEVARNDPSPEV